ncbi:MULTISPECIES: phospholipase A [Halomonadaceae]|uniref:Phospholipase A1 n=1 Tax=Vreelandella halophila TaxID=86177 RepID=A0A9X4YBI9_9GAMM|nr:MULTISPECIES: phospholipase A [Halomonas]MYL26223.1 phospholipase [Halomonas utahensis]MYL73215.1 phospholipase [Halomonas sp. 22501_18_FS]
MKRLHHLTLLMTFLIGLYTVPSPAHPHEDTDSEAEATSEPHPRERMLGESSILQPHRRNYLLPATRTGSPNQIPTTPTYTPQPHGEQVEKEEVKFQLSFRLPLLTGVFEGPNRLWFGYTQLAFWQLYNTEESSPFREINFEPEIFMTHNLGWEIGPGELETLIIGLNHESNGREEPFSRSWNRVKAGMVYRTDNWTIALEPWYRLKPSRAEDDNPDIERYLGYGELNAVYNPTGTHALGISLMNNLRDENNRTSVEINWSFPVSESIKAHIQYYNGYGESLIDYNERTHRIGLGVSLNDWL